MNKIFSRFIQWAEKAPDGTENYTAHSLIRLTRNRLGMTQKQLAVRCAMPQSHIAKIESGKADLQIRTLRRICRALCCKLVIGLRPDKDLDAVMEERAKNLARRRVRRVAGTMEMEKQLPEKEILAELVQAETRRILDKNDSAIWEDE